MISLGGGPVSVHVMLWSEGGLDYSKRDKSRRLASGQALFPLFVLK